MVNVLNESEFWKENIITAEAARVWVDANTLTVVCDTHRQEMVAAQEALEISDDVLLSTITVVQQILWKSIAYLFGTNCIVHIRARNRACTICRRSCKTFKSGSYRYFMQVSY